ncbi:GNAT family N-acetyltransferase|uniref:GNAT family N-acetyltransferase n=1 Tax=Noviherbaspirillum sp. L7-7A TaxID=2850560 RepID=UPI001C2B89D4|nr:GNAT family N-acetyltransferase [Noviherbaspirillum sp. L7-7A]MBV0877930.1 GNAT family N-acetyltransferase [Noviherbaspirillum sp. L7-7A]
MNNPIDYPEIIGAFSSDHDDSMLQQRENKFLISCHENTVPGFVCNALENLYGDLFSSLPYLETNTKITADTSTYVVRDNDSIITVLLFQRKKNQVEVINKGMEISGDDLRRFCDFIFEKYGTVDVILFDSIQLQIENFPYPCQRVDCPSDIVLDLPATRKDYLATLGSKTRGNIKRAMARLSSDCPSFRMTFSDGNLAEEKDLYKLINLNKARMNHINKVYARESEEIQKVIGLSKTSGLIGVARIDGSVCGGSIGYIVGSTHIGHIVSHDPKYDKYSLGMLSIYLTICECIDRGYKRFNFMSGNNHYKSLFGGAPRSLESIAIYRSRFQLALNPQFALRMIYGRWIYRSRLWVQLKLAALKKSKAEGKLDAQSKILYFILDHLRTMKDRASGLMKRF